MTLEKKPSLGLVLGGGDSADTSEEDTAGEDYESAKADGASAVMKAIKTGDATAFATTLEDFVKLCME